MNWKMHTFCMLSLCLFILQKSIANVEIDFVAEVNELSSLDCDFNEGKPKMALPVANNFTGPDQTICESNCVLLGIDPVPDYCYTWYNSADEILSGSSTYSACSGDVYTLVVSTDADLIAEEEVIVTETNYGLDLTIYDAKVTLLDSQSSLLVNEEIEESIGAQTFVNLDNDDNDGASDQLDNQVTDDDELMKLDVSASATDKVRIQALIGGATIKVYKNSNKTQPYLLGDVLSLDYSSASQTYAKTLWVEGVKPHSAQKSTILEVSWEGLECTDKVAITVLGISRIKWVGKGNGFEPPFHESHTLDSDPNFPSDVPIRGQRVFTGARFPNVNSPRNRVEAEIHLSTTPVKNTRIYVRSFDVDDPSDETEFIDPNDEGGSGEYQGYTDISYDKHYDNRTLDYSLKSGVLENMQASNIAPLYFDTQGNIGIIGFTTSSNPGDNYRLAANADYDFLKELRNVDDSDGFDIVHPNSGVISTWKFYTSPVLTVWRILHVENESMQGFEYFLGTQQKFVVMNNFTSSTGDFEQVETLEFKLTGSIDEGSNLDGPGPCKTRGRFEEGSLYFGYDLQAGVVDLGPDVVAISGADLYGNGNKFVQFSAPVDIPDIPCEISIGSGQFINAEITNIKKINDGSGSFKITFALDPNVSLLDYPNASYLRIGSNFVYISFDEVLTANSVKVNKYDFEIPILLRDDDATAANALLPHDLDLSVAEASFAEAYILVVDDGGGPGDTNMGNLVPMPFLENIKLPNFDFGLYDASTAYETNSFWTAYVFAAWQGTVDQDGDPYGELGTAIGLTSGFDNNVDLAQGGNYSAIFMEVLADSDIDGEGIKSTVAHELGHQFGLGHGTVAVGTQCGHTLAGPDPLVPEFPSMGLMKGVYDSNSPTTFIPRHINLIRSRKASPGNQ